jgi:hypothetical protein
MADDGFNEVQQQLEAAASELKTANSADEYSYVK